MAKEITVKSVQLSTFLKWEFGDIIGYETEAVSGKEMVTEIHCKLCARHIDKIKKDSKIKGQVQKEVEVFAMGTTNVKKYAVTRHLNSIGHHAAMDFDRLLGTGNEVQDDYDSDGEVIEVAGGTFGTQPRIDQVLMGQSRDAYQKLFTCAYNVATAGLPMRSFTTLVQTLKDVGVTLISGCDSSQRCVEFINFIAKEERHMIKVMLTDATSFAVLSDGSQARKTGSEKELVFVRVLHNGKADYFLAGLQDMDRYGAANASNVKTAIDDVFTETLSLDEDDYAYGLVSATADGAAVNTGALTGLFTQLREIRPWMINLHCVSHRIELAIKNSLLHDGPGCKNVNFNLILAFLVSIYYLMKKSPKVCRAVKKAAEIHNVQIYKSKKVGGTRFVNHQRVGLKSLINNWLIYIIAFEGLIAEKNNTTQKLPGILLKLRNVRFLVLCVYYKRILDIIAKLSLKFERGDIAVYDVMPEIEKTISDLDNLVDDHVDEQSFNVVLAESGITYNREDNEIHQKLMKMGHNKRKAGNREFQNVEYHGMIKESGAADAVRGVRNKIIPKASQCLRERFSSFDQQIFRDMQWLDPKNWDEDSYTEEVESILNVAAQFKREHDEYSTDDNKIKREWKSLRYTVKHYYSKLGAKALWKKLMMYKRKEFPNICKLAEAIMCIGPSNSTVEAGFSHLTAMLSDRRLNTSHRTMEDNLLVKVNSKVFTKEEVGEILSEALEEFLSCKKRKLKLSAESENKRYKVGDGDVDDDMVSDCDSDNDNAMSGMSQSDHDDDNDDVDDEYDDALLWEEIDPSPIGDDKNDCVELDDCTTQSETQSEIETNVNNAVQFLVDAACLGLHA